jgi:hypothetical protein
MNGLPTSLTICGTTWTVEYRKFKGKQYGSTNVRKRRIRISVDQQADLMRSTLLHEAIHACLALNGISQIDENTEERICQALEVPLLSLIRDNKVKW